MIDRLRLTGSILLSNKQGKGETKFKRLGSVIMQAPGYIQAVFRIGSKDAGKYACSSAIKAPGY